MNTFASDLPPASFVQQGMTAESFRKTFLEHIALTRASTFEASTSYDRYLALAHVVRDQLAKRWAQTKMRHRSGDVKCAYYLSAEYLLGRALGNNLINLGLWPVAQKVLGDLRIELSSLLEEERDSGLGNGGLGRLAACFLDSMATQDLPGMGYGIRYEFGIFRQEIIGGYQVERADEWLKFGNPWEIIRPELTVQVQFYGRIEPHMGPSGQPNFRWVGGRKVLGIPFDIPIAGYNATTVNTLRLWQARASEEFDFALFNDGDYEASVVEKNNSEVISKVLYPNDQNQAGKELRLKQEYFFVACSIADIVRRYLDAHGNFDAFPDKVAIQLNDTHPAIAIAELMRVLIDEKRVNWDKAWEMTVATFGYTNHTLLSEALERWPVSLFERLLPRHLQIIYEINHRFLRQVQLRYPFDAARLARMSLVEEGHEKTIRMAHLAVVGSHSVNGVAELHSNLLQKTVLPDFAEMFPERFNNKTNGVTPRRWLLSCNPRLARLITQYIGDAWIRDLEHLKKLEGLIDNNAFVEAFAAVKLANKTELAKYLSGRRLLNASPEAIFDIQIKRLHEYKRQLLNALHIVHLWIQARKQNTPPPVKRVFLFGAKSAPGYQRAKLIIRLINGIADVINTDSESTGLSVCFIPNYQVSLAERLIPAADVSEQISTAGMEASGTGNMKFAMNGALTLGTLDGANIEIRDAVGPENFFLFGLTEKEVAQKRHEGYRGRHVYENNPRVREVLELVASGLFSPENPNLYLPLIDNLLSEDSYLVLADFDAYAKAQQDIAAAFQNPQAWWRMSILNVARIGWFSSDRTIGEYARHIWDITPSPPVA
jgi:starch phosphorylase